MMAKKVKLKSGQSVLICRTDRIGDLILALPFIETFKTRYPDCHVDVLASGYAAPVLKNNPHIRQTIPVDSARLHDDKAYRNSVRDEIENKNCDIAVLLYPDKKISRILYQCRIPVRIGTGRRFHSIYFNRHIFHSRKANMKHESEYNLDFMTLFREGEIVKYPRIYLTDDELGMAADVLKDKGIDESFVILHPGSGDSADRWPPERFFELGRHLADYNIQVVYTGSNDEKELIDGLIENSALKADSLAGLTSLRTLAAVLSMAKVVVANSTGPLHLAAAVGTPVVGLYPRKKAMSPVRWGPLGNDHCVIMPPENGGHDMNTIDARLVAETVRDKFKRSEAFK